MELYSSLQRQPENKLAFHYIKITTGAFDVAIELLNCPSGSFLALVFELNLFSHNLAVFDDLPISLIDVPGTVNGNVIFGDNHGEQHHTTTSTQNNYSTDPETQKLITELQGFLAQMQTQHSDVHTEAEAITVVEAEFFEIKRSSPGRWVTNLFVSNCSTQNVSFKL